MRQPRAACPHRYSLQLLPPSIFAGERKEPTPIPTPDASPHDDRLQTLLPPPIRRAQRSFCVIAYYLYECCIYMIPWRPQMI
ncbi:hypothetical protein ZWY2020_008994 [Hordeum vulgare]|nr:hypothetical protein ZWY2020_008994 [Hordeum vulgare]